MRVVQPTLVYAVGLPLEICHEEALRDPHYFGQVRALQSGASSGCCLRGKCCCRCVDPLLLLLPRCSRPPRPARRRPTRRCRSLAAP